jgi:hypothetical protein
MDAVKKRQLLALTGIELRTPRSFSPQPVAIPTQTQSITIMNCVREIFGSNLSREANYPE